MDGEACVFGVDDVTAFEEGELVTPDPNQVLRVKGKHTQYCHVFTVQHSPNLKLTQFFKFWHNSRKTQQRQTSNKS